MTASRLDTDPTLARLLFGDGTPKKAFLTALFVGTVLTTINHGDSMFGGEIPSVWKVLLTYCVPYCVTTWGAFTGKRAQIKQQQTVDAPDIIMKAKSE